MKPTKEELRDQYREAQKHGDEMQMAIIKSKALGLGYMPVKDPVILSMKEFRKYPKKEVKGEQNRLLNDAIDVFT